MRLVADDEVILGTTMSLDGYINDRDGSAGRLYSDFADDPPLFDHELMQEAIRDTGAVVMGHNAFRMAEDPDSFADSYEFQVPLFVLTHTPPAKRPKENDNLTFTFVTDGIESAITQAKTAAKGRDVTIVGGAATAQQALRAGLVDELHIDIMPVLLHGGLRFFDHLEEAGIELEKVMVVELPVRTHLRFRVVG